MKQLLFIVSIIISGHNLSKLQSAKPKISFLIAEREYQTETSLPEFAESNLAKDYRLAFCHAENKGAQRHILTNFQEIANADLLFVSVRRRAFSKDSMHAIRKHISSGKPVLGIRTASHAFELRKEKLLDGHQEWPKWDRKVIGGNYNGHHGKGLLCNIKNTSPSLRHPILQNITLPFTTPATLYRNSPLPETSKPLLVGSVEGFPPEPVAWIHRTSSKGKVFYTSLGHIEDFKNPSFNRLLRNAIKWCLKND